MINYEVIAEYQDADNQAFPGQKGINSDAECWVIPASKLPEILALLATYDLPTGWRRRYLNVKVRIHHNEITTRQTPIL